MKQTETLDKLYLEWSQFTEARTGREIKLVQCLNDLLSQFGLDEGEISFVFHLLDVDDKHLIGPYVDKIIENNARQ